jgi:hypothetical protein
VQVFIFQSGMNSTITGFTRQQDGGNLPAEFAPWKPLSAMARTIETGDSLAGVAGGADSVLKGIAHNGFYVSTWAPREPRR